MKKQSGNESAQQARSNMDFGGGLRKPGRLASAWNKVSRPVRRGLCALTAALSLTFGCAVAAGAQVPETKPPAAVVVVANPSPKADYAHSEERLAAIKAMMRTTGLGQALLQFADEQKLVIEMSNSKVMGGTPDGDNIVYGTYGDRRIRLNADRTSDGEMMMTLAHEVRHAWHDLVIHESGLRLDAKRMLIKDRLLEADVFSFETHLAYEYEKATGVKVNLGDRAKSCDDAWSSPCMLNSYAADRAAGMSAPQAYGRLLERALKHVHAEDYDEGFLSDQDKIWQSVVDKPGTGFAWFGIGDGAAGLMSDADFAATMQRVATVGMTPGEGVSALAGWTQDDFLSLKKTGGDDVADDLDDEIEKCNDARQQWNLFWTDFLKQHPEIKVMPDARPLPEGRPVIHDGPRALKPGA